MPIPRFFVMLLALAIASAASAQTYPDRPVKVLAGFAPGGTTDAVLRQIATRLEQRMGTSFVIENRTGGSGTIAAAAVARAEPDGYTLLFGVAANLAVAPATMKTPPYDATTAFAPIVEVARGPYVWLVRSDAPARSMAEFIAWAKASPGKLNYASPGPGTVHHLATEMLKRSTAIDLAHVPYRSGVYVPLLAGEVHGMFESMPGPLPHLASGKLRALAVTGPRRLALLPDVPTLAEQGLPDLDVNSWWGFVGPAGLPRPIVARLNAEIAAALAEPELKAALAKWGIEASAGSAEAFGKYIAQESARWKRAVQQAGVSLE
jgi:tripartite-type tricarboxylate transporter receptor subunit TctC